MDGTEILKVYGPLGMGWFVALYLGRHILTRHDKQIDASVLLATALEKLKDEIRELRK